MTIGGRFILAAGCVAVLAGCSVKESAEYPSISPDYIGVTIPEGMAALNFNMSDGSRCRVRTERVADTLFYEVTANGVRYRRFPVYVSSDPIDPYIAYRLIEPGYESWHDIAICQRELASYKEKAIVTNAANNRGCVNCHTFDGGSPDRMIFHARGKGGGTVIIDGSDVRLLNLATVGPKKQGTYPAWHPSGRWIAFSSNTTRQCFFSEGTQPLEVYDTASDIILFDTQTDSVSVCPALVGDDELETFPTWSPDGTKLYYCSAAAVPDIPHNFSQLHYRLMSIDFKDDRFVGEPSVVYAPDSTTVSFPRVNGDWLLFTRSDCGTFPIWHHEADLWMLNLTTGEARAAEELNSPDTESYHSWSSNGRWVIFSSRRDDGRYTRLYIAHYDGDANFSKPFMLPQKKAAGNVMRLKSYNIPEFVSGEVPDRKDSIRSLFE